MSEESAPDQPQNKTNKPVILKSSLNFLKPSVLQTNGDSSSKKEENVNIFINNPFAKVTNDEVEEASDGAAAKKDNNEKSEGTPGVLPTIKLFSNSVTSTRVNSSGFVFGQNLHERVVGDIPPPKESDSEESKSENTTGLLFSSSLNTIKTFDKDKSKPENLDNSDNSDEKPSTSGAATSESEVNGCAPLNNSNTSSLSLEEAAKKYEEARGAQKRKYEEVETITGEEDEINIIEMSNCKLFTFVDQNWEERGRGILRLNDTKGENKQSRLVFRASGSLRVFLNTKVWSGMVCEQASQKSLRVTAIDANAHVKIFLVMGRHEDISLLNNALTRRINLEKSRQPPVDVEETKPETTEKSEDDNDNAEPVTKKASLESE